MNGRSLPTIGSNELLPNSPGYDSFSPNGKEDVSHSKGFKRFYNVYISGEIKKRMGPVQRQQQEICRVCGDTAVWFHYNALTCDRCKFFFRRSVIKNAVYECKYDNSCELDMNRTMRRKCQKCRLKKCLSVGMIADCVIPEYQCPAKRQSKSRQKGWPNSSVTKDAISPEAIVQKSCTLMSNTFNISRNFIKPVITSKHELIERLVHFQREFESPDDYDMKKITVRKLNR